ncbi:MAG: MSCRAMM family adhesin SdrC [Clostridiales bacterium]|nr:MSCRAMM family adhesin SdrC [Clostridiales bacterium]
MGINNLDNVSSPHPAKDSGKLWGYEVGISFPPEASEGDTTSIIVVYNDGSANWTPLREYEFTYDSDYEYYIIRDTKRPGTLDQATMAFTPATEDKPLFDKTVGYGGYAMFAIQSSADSTVGTDVAAKIEYFRFLDENGVSYTPDSTPEFGVLVEGLLVDPDAVVEPPADTDTSSDPVDTDTSSDPADTDTDTSSDPVDTDTSSDPADTDTDTSSDPVDTDTSGGGEGPVPSVDPGAGWKLVREWDFSDSDVDMSEAVISRSGAATAVIDTSTSPAALKVSGAGVDPWDGIMFKNAADWSLFNVNKKYKIIAIGKLDGEGDTADHAAGVSLSLEYQGRTAVAGDNWNAQKIGKLVLPGAEFEFEEVFTEPAAFGGFGFIEDFRIVLSQRYDPAITFYLDYYGIFESTESGGGEPGDPVDPPAPPPAVPTIPVMTFSFSAVSPGPSFSDSTPMSDSGASVPYRTYGNSAILGLNSSKLADIIAKAVDGTAVIDLSGVSGAEKVSIPKASLYAIANKGLDVEFILPGGQLTVSAGTAKALALAAKTGFVTFILAEIDPASCESIDQAKFAKGDIIRDFAVLYDTYPLSYDGGITVGINYEGDEAPGYVWIRNAAGNFSKVECTYNEAAGAVEFE